MGRGSIPKRLRPFETFAGFSSERSAVPDKLRGEFGLVRVSGDEVCDEEVETDSNATRLARQAKANAAICHSGRWR